MSIHKKHPLYCLQCGKKVKAMIDGKYCSDDCKTKSKVIKKGSMVFCNNCGKEFEANRAKSRFCPDCVKKNIVCQCFYPKSSKRIPNNKIPKFSFDRKFIYVGTGKTLPIECDRSSPPVPAEVTPKKIKRPRKNIVLWTDEELLAHGSINELSKIARERGFDSYGKFTAYLKCKCTKG